MPIPRLQRRALAAALVPLLAVACSGDSILGPPDGAACTRGTISIGELHEGEVSVEDGCILFDDANDAFAPAESWTLRIRANTAYIVRLTPVEDLAGDALLGMLYVYARNSAGDAHLAGFSNGSYGPLISGSTSAREMVFTADQDATVSIRVQGQFPTDQGPYTIEVLTCPVVTVPRGTTSAAVTLSAGCTLKVEGALTDTPVAFFNFAGEADETPTITATRTAGTSQMLMSVGGPGLNYSCIDGDCVHEATLQGAGPLALSPVLFSIGSYTVILFQQTAGTLTATVGVSP